MRDDASLSGIESIYRKHCATPTAISPHLPRLRALADGLDLVVEFGVKRGASSSALLMGAKRVTSFDVVETLEARELKRIAGLRWDYRIADSRTADVPPTPMLFVDSLHTYAQLQAELEAHARKVSRYIVLHDTITFGVVGAAGESGLHSWQYVKGQSCPPEHLGLRPAIDELLIREPSWRVAAAYNDSHGLLILERR